MKIIPITATTIELGRETYRDYLNAALCGPSLEEPYYRGMTRHGRVESIPGIVCALIDAGIRNYDAVIRAAMKVSRCRQNTVQRTVDALTGQGADRNLFYRHAEDFHRHGGGDFDSMKRIVIAA